MFELASAYPQLNDYYGVLVGLAYSVPYCLFGLLGGAATNRFNRKYLMITIMSLMSLTQVCNGAVDSFMLFAVMRFLHGCLSSFINPVSYSLLADYFPPDRRGTANSILSSANYLAIALSSLTIILIKNFGWKLAYTIMGGFGLSFSVLAALVIKVPKRGQYDVAEVPQEEEIPEASADKNEKRGLKEFLREISDLNQNPCCWNLFVAIFIRSIGSCAITAYMPVFFGNCFPAFKSQYALITALSLSIFGFLSSLVLGVISDRWEKKTYMMKSLVVIMGNTIATPLLGVAVLTQNFWLAVTCSALMPMVSGAYFGPAITMMQNSTDSKKTGLILSAYNFYNMICQTVAPMAFTFLAARFGAVQNPRVFGKLILAFTAFGYLTSNIFYWRGGKEYEKVMKSREKFQKPIS